MARRLAGVLWAMWRDGTFYEPKSLAQATGQGYQQHARHLQGRADAMARIAKKTKTTARWATRKLEAIM